jgi:hypothetical protein
MSLTAIPLQFEKYLQNQISVGNGPDMNEMIFAYIPDLDLTQPIDRSQGLPDVSLWVHQQDIDQVGKLGDNALVYSVVIPGSVDAFTFNAIYLRDKNVPNSCGMVVHKADETKENGMASTKSLMQQYTGAAQIAGINVDAATWQIDYQARLFGIEDDMRLANLDNYGHTAFVDGFNVTQQADPTKYAISAGVAYVGGLRAVLDDEIIQTINTKPNGLYLDVVRMGTALSQWQNVVTVRLSPVEMSDYVDGSNQQHFVAKLAGINADGSVADWRVKGGLGEHVAASDPHPQYMQHGDYGFGGSEFTPIAYGKLLSDINKTEYRLVSGGAIPSDSPEPTAALVFTKWANASNATQVWERLTSDQVPVLYRRVYRNGVWGGWVKDPTQASIQATYEKIANLKAAAYKNVGLDAGNVMLVGAFGLGVTNQISLEDDLDSILTNGFYYVPPNHPQSPTAGAGYVIVPHTTSSSNTVQLCFDAANDEVYFRRMTTDTIFEWRKLWSSGNTHANLAGSGYLKLPNGLIFQWGTVTGIGSPGSKTVTLPIAFTTAAYSATCAHKGESGGNATVSSFSLTQLTLFNESTSDGSSICYWIVGK